MFSTESKNISEVRLRFRQYGHSLFSLENTFSLETAMNMCGWGEEQRVGWVCVCMMYIIYV
jgi:hypothetical protein